MRPDMAGVDKNRTGAVCALLAVATLLLYWPATRNGFVNLDDHDYILDNAHVTAGLTWSGILWAMRSGYASNWHPLTWISHMLDCQLFGLNPWGHHLTNVLLHVANSVLVFVLLRRLTGSLWRSAFVAAFFAWHPLHVESVAWASERKDVLSAFFGLLTLLAWTAYVGKSKVQSPKSKVCYALALLFFALGLMSKSMLVTLPCVMLLMDYWPLRRTATPSPPSGEKAGVRGFVAAQGRMEGGGNKLEWRVECHPPEPPTLLSLPWGRLLVEKIPFFALALAASVVTYLVQQKAGAMTSLEQLPLTTRVANASLAYFQYLSKALWPVDLAAFYPFDRHPPVVLVAASLTLLVLFSSLFMLAAKRRPYLFTGWFWFVGMLVPTIGLVQVGSQSMADRYMYLPSIGLFTALVWGLVDFLRPSSRKVLAAAGAAALAGCIVLTAIQIGYWRDSETLFSRAIAVTRDNYVAYNGLGGALDAEHRSQEAFTNYALAVQINPRYPEGQYNLGTALLDQGQLDDAITHLTAALARNPDYGPAHANLGKALMKQGKLDEAAAHLRQAVELSPDYAPAHYNYATLLLRQSKLDDAIAEFRQAVRLQPGYGEAEGNLGVALMTQGRAAEGITHLTESVRLQPTDPSSHFNLALAFASQHQMTKAIAQYREILRLNPDHAAALNNLAWLLACDPQAAIRNGPEAVRLAQRACELSANQQAAPVITLAAAQAECGRFSEATTAAQKAIDLATAAHDADNLAKSQRLLALFQSGQPFRDNQ